MIRVVSYNVNGALDDGAVAEVLRSLAADLVCLQETPVRLRLRRIARDAGLDVAVRAGRRRVGTAILTGERVRVLSTARVPMTRLEGSPERALAHAIVGVGGLRLSVASGQLGMRPDGRPVHARDIERHLSSVGSPAVLGIDLNEPPSGPTARHLGEVLVDAFSAAGDGRGETYPTPDPSARPDHLLLDPALTVERCHVPTHAPIDRASHHRPVVADLSDADREAARDPLTITHATDEAEPAA